MGECESIGSCPFFNGVNDEDMKDKYCKKNNLNCARYMVSGALGKEFVPADLNPDEKQRAYMIIAENS